MGNKPEKSLSMIAQGISDPDQKREVMEWLTDLETKSRQWSIVQGGGDIDQRLIKEMPDAEFHGIRTFRCLAGTDVNQIDAYNRARELAESKGEPQMMDSYVSLILSSEVLSRLKDGRLVISGMDEATGPVLSDAGSVAVREKEKKDRPKK